MKISWSLFYAFFWLYRSAVSAIAQLVIVRFTGLGDSYHYQGQVLDSLEFSPAGFEAFETTRFFATVLTRAIGSIFAILFARDAVLINIGFQSIGFLGIVYFLVRLPPALRLPVSLILMLPTFTLWTSIAGKEAIVMGATGVIAGVVADMLLRGRCNLWHLGAAVLVVASFREHYLPGIIFLLFGVYVAQRVQQRGFLLLLGGSVSIVLLFVLQDVFSQLAYDVIPHFDPSGGTTREPFWDSPDEVLPKALSGMWLAFYGPTWEEARSGLFQMASFLESTLLMLLLLLFFIRHLPTAPVTMLVLAGFSIFWIMLTNYPMGVMNAGSAVRYRSGYEILIIACVLFVISRDTYRAWMQRTDPTARRQAQPNASPGIAKAGSTGAPTAPA